MIHADHYNYLCYNYISIQYEYNYSIIQHQYDIEYDNNYNQHGSNNIMVVLILMWK